LAGIAAASGVSVARLAAANDWSGAHTIARGDVVRIPMPASRAEASGAPPAPLVSLAPEAEAPVAPPAPLVSLAPGAADTTERPANNAEVAARAPREPVSERQTDAALLPAGAPSGSADATDYGVGPDDTVVVQAAETLGHLADWSGVESSVLRTLNKLHKNAVVTLGHKIKLDLSRVSAAQFVAARRDYHRQLQETFFAAHRIAGTENYSVKRGDSLWTIAEHSDLPIWLVAQYNPDVDFSDMRPGTAITLPRVAAINRQ
jgi:membrane-bound lytic murein transglycosylase D